EQVAHARGANAHKHLHEIGSRQGEEGYGGFTSHGLRQQGLARSRRAYKQCAFGYLSTEFGELAGILQELHDLPDLFFGLVKTGNIGECDLHLVLGIEKRSLGFTDVEYLSTGTTATCHPPHQHPEAKEKKE